MPGQVAAERAAISLAVALLVAPRTQAGVVNPKYAVNLTLYHVNEKNYTSSPRNMNTANIDGDMYFDLRTRGLPLECGPWVNQSFWSRLDCVNNEVNVDASLLAITKLIITADHRWGDYADCNIDDDTGLYSCECEDAPDNCTAFNPPGGGPASPKQQNNCNFANGCAYDSDDDRCEVYGCANISSRLDCVQGYHRCEWTGSACKPPPGPTPVCNGSLVGRLDLSKQDWGRHSHHGHPLTPIDYWHGNTLSKTFGWWYSTWAEGECKPDDPTQGFCSWQLTEVVKKIGKTCSDDAIDATIVAGDKSAKWGAQCFDKCSSADQKNTTSECWIECFYSNVLGPAGSSSLLNHTSPNFGIPLVELQAAWDKPFKPESEGGCPAMPHFV